MTLHDWVVFGVGMKIQSPLIYAQVYGDAVIGRDLHVATIAFNMDVSGVNRDIFVLRFFEDGITYVVSVLAINRGEARHAFDAVLELHVVHQDGDNFNSHIDGSEKESKENDQFEAAAAALR